MIDCGAWRIETGVVVRLQGRELLLSEYDANRLYDCLHAVCTMGLDRSVSDGYLEAAAEAADRRAARPLTIPLAEALGLTKPKPNIERRF